jgi:DNA gyrase subunit A
VIAIQTTERNGAVVGAMQVAQDDELMLISQIGTLVRIPVADISVMGRNTQGVRLIRLDDEDRLVGIERVEGLQEEDDAPADV